MAMVDGDRSGRMEMDHASVWTWLLCCGSPGATSVANLIWVLHGSCLFRGDEGGGAWYGRAVWAGGEVLRPYRVIRGSGCSAPRSL